MPNDRDNFSQVFVVTNYNEDLNLEKYVINYNGQDLPIPFPQLNKTNVRDTFTQRYYETMY